MLTGYGNDPGRAKSVAELVIGEDADVVLVALAEDVLFAVGDSSDADEPRLVQIWTRNRV